MAMHEDSVSGGILFRARWMFTINSQPHVECESICDDTTDESHRHRHRHCPLACARGVRIFIFAKLEELQQSSYLRVCDQQ